MPGKKENRPILKTPDGTGTAGIGETGRMAGTAKPVKTSKLKRSKAAVRKGTGLQDTLKKRSRQLRYLQYGLQAAIRVLNALDRKTIYRR